MLRVYDFLSYLLLMNVVVRLLYFVVLMHAVWWIDVFFRGHDVLRCIMLMDVLVNWIYVLIRI